MRTALILAIGIAMGMSSAFVFVVSTASTSGDTGVVANDQSTTLASSIVNMQDAGVLTPPNRRTTDALSRTIAAVVRIQTGNLTGTGFVIDAEGLVVTSAHLLKDAAPITVIVEDRKTVVGTIERLDTANDLALIRLEPGVYRTVELADNADLTLGGPVTAIGYPLSLAGPATVTRGIVSRILQEANTGRHLIQTDASINAGNSGGPLLNEDGKVIGIVTSFLGVSQSRQAQGISFAVSVETIRSQLFEEAFAVVR